MFGKKQAEEEANVQPATDKPKKTVQGSKLLAFSLKGKILMVLIGLVALFCVVITLVLNQRSNSFIEEQAIKDIDNNLAAFELLIEEGQEKLGLIYHTLASDVELTRAASDGNRYIIADKLKPLYETLNQEFGVTALQFIDTNLQGRYMAQEPLIQSVDYSDRPLLIKVREQKTLQYGVDLGHQGLTVRAAGPVYDGNRLLGYLELGHQLDNDYLDRLKDKIGVDLTMFSGDTRIATTLVDSEGQRAVGTTLTSRPVLTEVLEGGGRWAGRVHIVSGENFGAYSPIRDPAGEIIGMTFAGSPADIYDARRNQDRMVALTMLAVALIITTGVSFLLTGKIVGPVTDLARVLEKVATGDFSIQVKDYGKDEVGLIGRSVAHLITGFRELLGGIVSLSERVDTLSGDVSNSTEEINSSIQDVAGSSNEVAASAGELNTSSQEMNRQSQAVMAKAVSGEKVMEGALEQMRIIRDNFAEQTQIIGQLERRSAEIGEIIQVINDISEQTNLLALNAAIEAARAGQYGRGFAVVADEVRKLAERSSVSTEEIAHLIKATQQDTDQTVSGMGKNTTAIKEGASSMAGAADTFREIVAAIQDLINLIEEVAGASQELSANIEEVAAATEEQSAAVTEISRASSELQEATGSLRNEFNKFHY